MVLLSINTLVYVSALTPTNYDCPMMSHNVYQRCSTMLRGILKVTNRITLSDITMDKIFAKSFDISHNRGKNQDRQKQSEGSRKGFKTIECDYCHVIFTGRGNKKYYNEKCKYAARIQDPVFCQKQRERSKESYSRRTTIVVGEAKILSIAKKERIYKNISKAMGLQYIKGE